MYYRVSGNHSIYSLKKVTSSSTLKEIIVKHNMGTLPLLLIYGSTRLNAEINDKVPTKNEKHVE
jgi:hypothetical protein